MRNLFMLLGNIPTEKTMGVTLPSIIRQLDNIFV